MRSRIRQLRVRLNSCAVCDHLTRRNISQNELARLAELPVRARGRDLPLLSRRGHIPGRLRRTPRPAQDGRGAVPEQVASIPASSNAGASAPSRADRRCLPSSSSHRISGEAFGYCLRSSPTAAGEQDRHGPTLPAAQAGE